MIKISSCVSLVYLRSTESFWMRIWVKMICWKNWCNMCQISQLLKNLSLALLPLTFTAKCRTTFCLHQCGEQVTKLVQEMRIFHCILNYIPTFTVILYLTFQVFSAPKYPLLNYYKFSLILHLHIIMERTKNHLINF